MGSTEDPAAADDAADGGRAAQILRTLFEEIEEKKIRAVEVFFAVDTDGSGEMDRMEFEEALHMMGFTELSVDDMDLAFHELDADKGGTIEIEEFMGRMRVEKKWRQAREEKKRGVDPDSDRRIGSLTGDDKLAAINAAGRDMWDKSVMRAALSIWGDQMPADMDEDEAAWRREELEAQMAEMAAEEEEKEAEAAEALYNKEEREAVEAERALAREEAEAKAALAAADREQAEALAAIAVAEKEEDEAKRAEEEAMVEVEEAEIARLDAEREQMEAKAAKEAAEIELADVLRAESDLQNAEADLDVARATNDQAAIEAAEASVAAKRIALDREKKEAFDAVALADKEQAEADEAMAVATKEKAEALEAIENSKRERAEAEEAKRIANQEMAEAVEAKADAEREMAEAEQARADAERERAEADEAKAIAKKERAEADEARRIAIKERAEANAAKEVWAQRKAMEQALNWKRKTKQAKKKKKRKVKKEGGPPPRSVVEDMLGRVVGNLVRFESEYKAERQDYSRASPVAEHARARAERLQALRLDYAESLARNTAGVSPRLAPAPPAAGSPRHARRSPRGSPRHRDPTSLAYGGPSGRTKTGLTPRQVQRKNGDVVTTSLAAARQAARATVTVRDPTVYREAALLNAYDRSTN